MEDFIIRTVREGTIKTNDDIEGIINKIGKGRLDDRLLGKVTAIVEKEKGVITKALYRFADDNEPAFNDKVKADAEALVAAAKKAIEGNGGDDVEVRIRVVAKR